MGAFYVLFESASGYAIVEVVEYEEIASLKDEVQASVQDLTKVRGGVQLREAIAGVGTARGTWGVTPLRCA